MIKRQCSSLFRYAYLYDGGCSFTNCGISDNSALRTAILRDLRDGWEFGQCSVMELGSYNVHLLLTKADHIILHILSTLL